jgi:molybdopterin molybdotransferase
MISFEQAYKIVIDSAILLPTETVNLLSSLNRVLAEDIFSDMDMPPFDKSAMDGYACRKEDLKNDLEVIETIPAGKIPQKKIGKNQCAKIMTGAMLPSCADCVIIVENTEITADNKIRFTKEDTRPNITYKATDIKKGSKLISKGIVIKSQHIALFALTGKARLLVYSKLKAGIISTGDELVEPEIKPKPSQIRNSNAYQLLSQLQTVDAVTTYYGIVKDDEALTYQAIKKALAENDIVILTGGVSMGDYDYVPKIFEKLDIKILFDSIAVQPGRPSTFGIIGEKACFGLPGNPVSAFFQFELLVKPFILKRAGVDYAPLTLILPMGKDYIRTKSSRLSWLPVKIARDGLVYPLEYHGSAHINSLTEADGIISINIGETILKKGTLVYVRQI